MGLLREAKACTECASLQALLRDAARPRVEIYITVLEPRAVQEDLPLQDASGNRS